MAPVICILDAINEIQLTLSGVYFGVTTRTHVAKISIPPDIKYLDKFLFQFERPIGFESNSLDVKVAFHEPEKYIILFGCQNVNSPILRTFGGVNRYV